MGLPSFVADASLYKGAIHYHLVVTQSSNSIAPTPDASNPSGVSAAAVGPPGPGDCIAWWMTRCGGVCTDTWTDNKNCGGCGAVCPDYKPDCCGGVCVHKPTSTSDCGECGNQCGFNQACCNGVCTDLGTHAHCTGCAFQCASWQTCCGVPGNYACVNTTNNPQFCGDCITSCAAGEICSNGHCCPSCYIWLAARPHFWPPTSGCYSCADVEAHPPLFQPKYHWGCCNGMCTNTDTDEHNCGQCGNNCTASDLRKTCVPVISGYDFFNSCTWDPFHACVVGRACQCPSGLTDCGVCVDVTTDAKNCGHCGNDCAALMGPGSVCVPTGDGKSGYCTEPIIH
jgi:Stigma-specific protein, Stig1